MSVPDPQDGYQLWLTSVKEIVRRARARAGLAANARLVALYWQIGRDILDKQKSQGWGAGVIPRLAKDLGKEFGERGFSPRNLKYMRDFAEAWDDPAILQHAAAKLPWGHHQVLLDRLPKDAPMAFYVERAVDEAWTRAILIHQIETRLDQAHGRALSNFSASMPEDRAAKAVEFFKDPYVLNFLGADDYRHERHLQASLILRVKDLLIELGKGFSFFGENFKIEAGEEQYYLDLIFYHT